MNRIVNALLIFILFPTMLLTIIVGFDLPVGLLKTSGANIPYSFEIFLGLGLLILVIILRRTIRRWMGLIIVSKQKKFKWNSLVSSTRKKRVITYLLLEALTFTFISIALYNVTEKAWMPALAFGFGALDHILFAIIGSMAKGFRVGLSSKALIVADREVTVMYFTGLRKVSIHQQSIYFDYIKGLQLSFPSDCIEESDRSTFFDMLEKQIDSDRVFFSKTMV